MGIACKLTASLEHWLITNEPKTFVLIGFGHLECFTDDMKKRYLEWVQTDEGKEYLVGGSKYHDPR